MVTLDNGCMCCEVNADLAGQLRRVLRDHGKVQQRFDVSVRRLSLFANRFLECNLIELKLGYLLACLLGQLFVSPFVAAGEAALLHQQLGEH